MQLGPRSRLHNFVRRMRGKSYGKPASRHRFCVQYTPADELQAFLDLVSPTAVQQNLVRLGSAGDGGYLVPDDLSGIHACFSPGVAHNADFEQDMTLRGSRCYLADYSVDVAPISGPLIDFEKKFVGDTNDEFHIRLQDWVFQKIGDNKDDLLLQMDIEGEEYLVISDTPIETLRRFRIIIVEFHELNEIFIIQRLPFIRHVFRKLIREFVVVHIHPNNNCPVFIDGDIVIPSVMEFTFLRRDRIVPSDQILEFPHPLDAANVANKPDVVLPQCWY